MKTGAKLIYRERDRQQNAEGWTAEHDDTHSKSELALAGITYAIAAVRQATGKPVETDWKSVLWPWDKEWWKPSPDPILNLTKAGALIAAEIDRLLRAQKKSTPSNPSIPSVPSPSTQSTPTPKSP